MDRSKKAEAVAQLNVVLKEVGVVVVTRNLGMSVDQSTDIRGKMREAGVSYMVAKNRLAKLALKDTDYSGLEEFLSGPTALAWSEDPVAAAKVAVEFAKSNDKLEIVGGSMGTQVLDEAGVKALASMPSLDELRGMIIGLINAPATKVARVANEPANKLARVFGAYAASEGGNAAQEIVSVIVIDQHAADRVTSIKEMCFIIEKHISKSKWSSTERFALEDFAEVAGTSPHNQDLFTALTILSTSNNAPLRGCFAYRGPNSTAEIEIPSALLHGALMKGAEDVVLDNGQSINVANLTPYFQLSGV